MSKLLTPFEYLKPRKLNRIYIGWFLAIILLWFITSFTGETHLFPTIPQVIGSYSELINKFDLMPHLFQTFGLSFKSVLISIILSMVVVYLTPLNLLKPLGTILSQLRYLPFVGLSFFMAILFPEGRNLQTSILVLFTTTFLITTLLSYLKDIPQEEFDNAKTMGMTRWEILWEVVIIGRMDYVFEAVRQNLAIVTMSIVTVETILPSMGGIGFLLGSQSKLGNHDSIVALQLLILLGTIFLDNAINFARKKLFPYSNF